MSRGKGGTGCPMQIVSTTKRKWPKWLARSYEERTARRNASSARRLKRLEAKGKVHVYGVGAREHCGQPTQLTQDSTAPGGYVLACVVCGIVPIA